MTSASDQKLFCEVFSAFNYSFNEFVGEKVVSPSYSSTILAPPRKLYAGQEATVRTGREKIDWLQIGEGVCQGCILSPCLFNLYAEYIMWNARLDEPQAEIKIARININNLRYADDTVLMANVKKKKRASWWKWKERVKKLA